MTEGDCPAHPVLCHLLDVAAVASHLLTAHIPRALRHRLLEIVPGDEAVAFKLLLFLIALHDLGKYTPAFQGKLEWAARLLRASGFDLSPPSHARRHGPAGFEFVRDALLALGMNVAEARGLARAVVAHHGEFPTNASLHRAPMGRWEQGESPRWDAARRDAVTALRDHFGVPRVAHVAVDHAYIVALAGLTSVADWIGSMQAFFPYEPPDQEVASYWPRALERAARALAHTGLRAELTTGGCDFATLFPAWPPRPLHRHCDALGATLSEPALMLIEAPMGEGKTEAALLLAQAAAHRLGQHGLYFGLPTRATANQMFGRIAAFLDHARATASSTLVLAHADAQGLEAFHAIISVGADDPAGRGGVRAEEWFLSKKRALLAECAVGTIDQALLGVLRTPHGFVRLFGLAGKTLVLDEVHAYDTFTSTILDRLLAWAGALGTTVILLSATLPRKRRRELLSAYRMGAGGGELAAPAHASYPRVTTMTRAACSEEHVVPSGTSLVVHVERIDPALAAIARRVVEVLEQGGCVGWICNTVDRAQAACEALAALAPDLRRLLLHARMLPHARAERERQLAAWLGPEDRGAVRPDRLVVIGTQVLEQSLDIDFDLLISDLAPIDLILQRAGRLHRHRARTNRARAHAEPRLWLAYPAGAAATTSISEVAGIYAEALVRATIEVLDNRSCITLPDEIELLVDAVYRENLPAADDVLFDAYIGYAGKSYAQRQNAETRLLPSPMTEDDIFGNLTMPFDDDEDPQVHEELRAITRDGELSVQVVCLVGRDGHLWVADDAPAPIDPDVAPDRLLMVDLAARTIGVSSPEPVVRALINDAEYSPASWKDRALLRHRRALVFRDNAATVAGYRLELHEELGLRLRKPRTD